MASPSPTPGAPLLSDLKLLLGRRDGVRLALFGGFLLAGALWEVLALASVPLFLSLLLPEKTPSGLQQLFLRLLGGGEGLSLLWKGGGFLLAANLLRTLWAIWGMALQYRFQANRRRELTKRLLAGYLQAPVEFFRERTSPELMNQVAVECDNVVQGTISPLMEFLRGGANTLCVVILLLLWAPLMTLAALLLLGGACALLTTLRNRRLRRFARQEQEGRQATLERCAQALAGRVEAAVYGRRLHFLQRVCQAVEGLARAQGGSMLQIRSTWPVLELLSLAALLAVSLGALAFAQGDLSRVAPQVALLAMALVRLRSNAIYLMQSALEFRRFRPSLHKVCRDLREQGAPAGEAEDRLAAQEKVAPLPFQDALEWRQVSFTYPGAREAALSVEKLRLSPGDSLAVVGPTGCGKTTFLQLLLGLRFPQEGGLAVDGLPLTPENAPAWWRNVAYLPQKPFLLEGTLAENVTLGLSPRERDQAALEKALSMAQLQELVRRLPQGADTELEPEGQGLSGGEIQRIALARALYRRPRVLVLDEATNALDPRTEHAFRLALEELRGKTTLVTVTHGLHALREEDQILFLEKGRVAAQGTLQSLKLHSPAFQKFLSGTQDA
ncbi:MAG: ATP-binding cassette domain-containing protein [Oligosphaeraceae bacterium]